MNAPQHVETQYWQNENPAFYIQAQYHTRGNISFIVSDIAHLEVLFDSTLNMEQQVNSMCRSCYAQLRNISRMRNYLTAMPANPLLMDWLHQG